MTDSNRRILFLSVLASICHASLTCADKPFLTTPTHTTLLSANDGEFVIQLNEDGLFDKSKRFKDSITVIQLSPDKPPISRTVFGTVPNNIIGAPYLTLSEDGSFGFVSNHGLRIGDDVDETLIRAKEFAGLVCLFLLVSVPSALISGCWPMSRKEPLMHANIGDARFYLFPRSV
jgi:hypothetical protein